MDNVTSLLQAIRHFTDKDNCRKFMIAIRWADGVVKCPTCGSDKVVYLEKQDRYKCYGKHPRAQFSLKVGTIFEDSPLGLDKWLPAAWLVINCKNGISSYELHRDLQVTQKTAWFMLHRVRLAMQTGTFNTPLSGEVEVDETFIGGKARNMHKNKREEKIQGRGVTGKVIVMGMLERGGKVRAKVVSKRNKKTLQAEIRENVEAGSEIFSDELLSYWGLEKDFVHQIINHAKEYVRGNVHTNGMENFWSLLKRGLNGTYISVEPFHLFRYLDEQMFRFNYRHLNDGERFEAVLKQIVGRRVTYAELTGNAETAQP
jgi:transposase-like protein